MTSFTERLARLDTTIFDEVVSQSADNDRRSLLACQLAVRALVPSYTYLEIGSHRGGRSIPPAGRLVRPHRLDDKRTASQPDERVFPSTTPTTPPTACWPSSGGSRRSPCRKLTCIDGDSSRVTPAEIASSPDLCFIDGEHTDRAVREDFRLCSAVLADKGAIVFHDAQVIYNALIEIVDRLRASEARFHAYNLPDTVFVIELGDFPIHATPAIRALLLDNHVGYLAALRSSDPYRRFTNRAPFRLWRRLRSRLRFAGR
ncbi:MAG: class I SAM-dependent methyltransferase [Thermoanaerobaculia bacterium]